MALPANQDTSSLYKCYVNSGENTHIQFIADADYTAGDFLIWGPYAGVVDTDVLTGETGSLHIEDTIEIQTKELTDAFGTLFMDVWFDTSDDTFYNAGAANRYNVGPLSKIKDADGVISFYKRIYPVAYVAP